MSTRADMEYILDFQGFKSVANKFIVKELALISVDSQVYELHLLQPPCDFSELPFHLQKQVMWLEKHCHGLYWGSGFRKYENLKEIFLNVKIQGNVYVKGKEKQKFVSDLLSDLNVKVINLEDLGCPKLEDLKSDYMQTEIMIPCNFNHNTRNCAYVNVQVLLKWWKLEKLLEKKLELVNAAIKECYTKGYIGMNPVFVKYLPTEFIINHHDDIDKIYDRLPEKLKNDVGILLNRRCYEHFAQFNGDTFDGPNPKRKNCVICLSKLHNTVQSPKMELDINRFKI
jgi:hypothetical protein